MSKPNKKTVSIVIPSYNRPEALVKVLPSYLSQSGLLEIIIVNDCSSLNYEKVEKYCAGKKQIKLFRNDKNRGAPYCRNFGVAKARGEFIFFGEDDLILETEHIKTLTDHLRQQKTDLIAGRRIWMQAGETRSDAKNRADAYRGEVEDLKLLLTNCQIDTGKDEQTTLLDASMLIKKTVFEKVKYDEYYSRNSWREETDFQIGCQASGFKAAYCPHAVSYHLPKINDKGGNHAKNKLKYELQILKNSWYLRSKYTEYLERITGPAWLYMARLVVYRMINNWYPFIWQNIKR